MSSVRAHSLIAKFRGDLRQMPSLAREWRLTRRRSDDGAIHGLAESGRVLSQQTTRVVGSARLGLTRLTSNGRLRVIGREMWPRARGYRADASVTRAPAESDLGRPHVVLICYACEPGAGSEEGVGWAFTRAAASVADVTVFTRPPAIAALEQKARELGLPISVKRAEPPKLLRSIATRRWGGFGYYVLWQGAVKRSLRQLERTSRVDAVHHVTWGSDSLPSAVRKSTAPIRIWGPVGGSTRTPFSLFRYLSPRARFDEVVRTVVNGAFRRIWGDRVARSSTLVLALNHDVEAHFQRFATPVIVEPHCALDPLELAGPVGSELIDADDGRRTALFVGRLMGWKGPLLAIESLVHAPEWKLVVLGQGGEREGAEALAVELGVDNRVDFRGLVPRPEVLAALRTADALLFPSFHDSAPWAVAEAATVGCPVVCLDAGGPPLIAGRNAHVVAITPAATLAQRIGLALESLDGRGEPEDAWHADRLPGLLTTWYGIDARDRAGTADPS